MSPDQGRGLPAHCGARAVWHTVVVDRFNEAVHDQYLEDATVADVLRRNCYPGQHPFGLCIGRLDFARRSIEIGNLRRCPGQASCGSIDRIGKRGFAADHLDGPQCDRQLIRALRRLQIERPTQRHVTWRILVVGCEGVWRDATGGGLSEDRLCNSRQA